MGGKIMAAQPKPMWSLLKFARVVMFSTLALAGGLTCSASAAGKLIEGFVSHGALQWPEYIAEQFGWFKEADIEVEMVSVGATAAQQLAAGSINLGYSGFPDFVRAANQGAPLRIVINGIGTPPYAFYAKPSIKTIADLKGKTVSIGASKDITLIYTEAFIAAAGLKSKDPDFIYAKATPDRFAALVAGGADAAMLYPPFTFRAAALGFTNLGDIEPALKGFPFTVWAVNVDWAQKNRETLLAYVKAYGKAVRWLYEPKNKDEAVQILVKYSKADAKDAADTYDYFVTKLKAFSQTGVVAPESFERMREGLMSMGDLPASAPPIATFFDTTYVDTAWK
jgi:NitT/TauT family transport system substrate-binding protein